MQWKKPTIIEYNMKELTCIVHARADSPCKSGNHAEEVACPVLSTADTWCNSNPQGLEGGGICILFTTCDTFIFG